MLDFLLLCGNKYYKFPRKSDQKCPICDTKMNKKYVQNWCCLFFIPLVPLGKGYTNRKCKNCGYEYVK